MKEIYYVYNNEAIASCIFLSVLKKVQKIDIARSCLVLPFLMDDKTVAHIVKNQASLVDLENTIAQHPRLFASFNKRFLSLLPITINAIMILKKASQVIIKGQNIEANDTTLDFSYLGDRWEKIREAVPFYLNLTERYSTEQLYKTFKVQL